ncbi:hypothetical protein [Actinoplanes couchii]|uniref:Uncharacterized protein n=1 Tax=Actinoplanes couchii TaxID=403638 RepID=A0ABQ3XTX4_9ACTN|nr:hypothetical protein [Actinoplanes couchii]MDR6318509.1 hypothetical protein [Actinoplanes couchii]GID61958.1 hypothetical protein Aco03nite_103620 [Actinoplanes couchii]
MLEITNLRIFSKIRHEFPGRYQGCLLVGVVQEKAEIIFGTPWGSEEEAERSLNARYAALVAGSRRWDNRRIEGMMELDNLLSLCGERNTLLDDLAAREDDLLDDVLNEMSSDLLGTLIDRSIRRLMNIAGADEFL